MAFLKKYFKSNPKSRKCVLEHEILKILYEKGVLIVKSHGNITDGRQAIFKKVYENSNFHFGTLVDILNNPQKYNYTNIPFGRINFIQEQKVTIEDVVINDFQWSEVSDALEVLNYNKHIYDNIVGDFLDLDSRRISLTQEGAFAFRDGHYLNEALKKISIEKQFKIQKLELWQKQYWIIVELSKYIIGGIVGSIITLLITKYFK
jgi:hypothetical protein